MCMMFISRHDTFAGLCCHSSRLSNQLSSLPEEVCREQALSRVLEMMTSSADQQMLRIRPQLFLKMLRGAGGALTS